MGNIAKGNRSIFAYVPEATYGTPALAAAGHGIVLGPGGESITSEAADIPDDTLEGEHQEKESERGSETHGGDFANAPLMFDSVHRLIAPPMGNAGVPTASIVQVVEGINDRIDGTEGTSGAFVAALTPGNYDRVAYAAMVEAAIAAAATDNTYTVDFGVTLGDSFSIVRNVGTDTIDLPWLTGPNAARSAARMMGFTADDTGLTTYSGDVTVIPIVFRHVLTPAALLNAAFGTVVVGQASLYVKEYVSAMFNGFTLNYPNQEKINVVLPLVPHALNMDDNVVLTADKPLNRISTLGTITRPGVRDIGLWRQTKVRWNPFSSAALAAADRKFLSSHTLVCTNNFVTDDFTLEFGDKISQPVRDNKVQFSGTFEFSRLVGDLQDLIVGLARSPQKAESDTVGNEISGQQGQRFRMTVFMPIVQFNVASNVGGPGRVPKSVNALIKASETTPTGFPSGYTDAMTIEIINTSATDPLAA